MSLVKGVAAKGTAVDSRRYLRHMRFDRATGRFMATEKRIKNRVTVGYELNVKNYEILSEEANSNNEMTLIMGKLQFTRKVDKEPIADTGATVVSRSIEMMRGMGLEMNQLLPTYMTLVMGTV